jgi:isoleucyl-tRNA synthetase
LAKKDLISKDFKPMHICPRCETTLSNNEVTEGYKDIKDLTLTAKFELEDEKKTFVLA